MLTCKCMKFVSMFLKLVFIVIKFYDNKFLQNVNENSLYFYMYLITNYIYIKNKLRKDKDTMNIM